MRPTDTLPSRSPGCAVRRFATSAIAYRCSTRDPTRVNGVDGANGQHGETKKRSVSSVHYILRFPGIPKTQTESWLLEARTNICVGRVRLVCLRDVFPFSP